LDAHQTGAAEKDSLILKGQVSEGGSKDDAAETFP
jgi:hypothetical protein